MGWVTFDEKLPQQSSISWIGAVRSLPGIGVRRSLPGIGVRRSQHDIGVGRSVHGEGSLFLLLDWGGLTLLDRGRFLVAVDVDVDLVAGRTVEVVLYRGGRLLWLLRRRINACWLGLQAWCLETSWLLRRLETCARLLKLVVGGKNTLWRS